MPGSPIPSREPSNVAGLVEYPGVAADSDVLSGLALPVSVPSAPGLFQTGDSGLTVVGDCLDESLDCAKPP